MTFRFLIFWLIAAMVPCFAAPPARRLLVAYKSSEGVTAKENEVRWHLAPILARQGWKLDYHDVDASLPDGPSMMPYQAVLTWHRTAKYKNPTAYVRWLKDQLGAGRKVVILGNFGAHTSDLKTWLPNETLNEFFQPFGLEFAAGFTADRSQLQLVSDSALARAPQPLSYYMLYRSANAANQLLLVVRRKDLANSDSAMVVRTPHGGMAAETCIYQQQGSQLNWLLNREKFLTQALTTTAEDAASGGGHLLALFKGSEKVDAETNFIRRFLAGPLKELGYTLDYRDIAQGLPADPEMTRYQGVITWYQTASMENAAAYCQWLLQQIVAGRKVVIFGTLGAFQELDKSSHPPTDRWLLSHEYNSFLYPFGLEFKGAWTKDPQVLKVVTRDPQMIPWLEPAHLAHYFWLDPVSPEDKPYLLVNRSDMEPSQSAFIVRTPYGGYALESYLLRDQTGKGEYRFHLDVKAFLRDCLTYKPARPVAVADLSVKPTTLRDVPPESTLPPTPQLPAGTVELKRHILAFYQRDLKETSERNRIHDAAESILNHLGLVVDYRAIEDPLPTDAQMERYRGILTSFQSTSIPRAQAYADWLKANLEKGRLAVILGDYGAYQDRSLASQVKAGPALAALGVDFRAAAPTSGLVVTRVGTSRQTGSASVEFQDPVMCKGELAINLDDPDLKRGWPTFLAVDPQCKVYLRVKDADGQVCDAVVVTPRGGLIAGEFLQFLPPALPIRLESVDPAQNGPAVAEKMVLPKYRIDAYRFFAEAFQVQDFPRCDVTTLNGSRIFFSHIDGDAMHGMSLIDRASLNAEMMLRQILAVYKVPVTVSFVTNNLVFKATPTYQRELKVARQILALPWVETACHTHTHPFNWRLGDLRRRPGSDEARLERFKTDNAQEIAGSVDFINQHVAPPEKPCRVLLWSGMCNPGERELAVTDALGATNMNGGDPVYDSVYPYLAGVSPLYSVVGGRYQFHTCAAGDFYFTGAWTRDYDGLKNVVEYFRYTEEPRRLRAMNLYYHFYLAERLLGLSGLKAALDYVLLQQPASMFVSDYVSIVKDMIVTRLGRDAQGNLVIANARALRTLRFEDCARLPDLARSRGVLGYLRTGNRLYVHLDEAPLHTLAWTQTEPTALYLERASHYVEDWKPGIDGVHFRMRGTGPAFFTLTHLKPATAYQVKVAGVSQSVATDAAGRLSWTGTFEKYQGEYAVSVGR